jgi:hypothetical protein
MPAVVIREPETLSMTLPLRHARDEERRLLHRLKLPLTAFPQRSGASSLFDGKFLQARLTPLSAATI